MSKVLVILSLTTQILLIMYAEYYLKIVKLVEELDEDVVLVEEFQELQDLFNDASTYPSNNIPCEITAIYTLSVIY